MGKNGVGWSGGAVAENCHNLARFIQQYSKEYQSHCMFLWNYWSEVLKLVFFWSVSKYSNPSFVSKVYWIKHLQIWEQLWDHNNHQKSSEPTSVCLCRVFPTVLMLPIPKLWTTFWLQDKISISALLDQPHTVCVYCKWLVIVLALSFSSVSQCSSLVSCMDLC